MTDFSVADPRSSAPVSNEPRQEALALSRLAGSVRELQRIAAQQALPRGLSWEYDSATGDLLIVDQAQGRQARLTWEPA